MSKIYSEEQAEVVFAEAKTILTELRKSRRRALRMYFRVIQEFVIWLAIFLISLSFAFPALRDFYLRNTQSQVDSIDWVSITAMVVSGFRCITLGTVALEVSRTLRRASHNLTNLSESLRRSQHKQDIYEG